jgi:hypothetical protein
MRSRLLLAAFLITGIVAIAARARAATNTTPVAEPPPLSDSERAAACVERVEALLVKLAGLEQAARDTNEIERADCIHARHVKITALGEVVRGLQRRLDEIKPEDDPDLIDAGRAELEIACARAAQLAVEAESCAATKLRSTKKRRPPAAAAKASKDAGKKSAAKFATQPARPDESNCLRQEQLAALLARAMELRVDAGAAPAQVAAELGKLAIEPLNGWQTGRCATLDDLSVAVSRALNLAVENPSDPAAYTQALREFGLPVDTLLPARPPQGEAPPLTEPEVRAFFAHGLAAPLPTSRPLIPD